MIIIFINYLNNYIVIINNRWARDRPDHYSNYIKSFYASLPIREKTALIYNEKAIHHLTKNKIMDEYTYKSEILEKFLICPDHVEISEKIFNSAKEYYAEKNMFPEYLISLLFLTSTDKSTCKVTFNKMVKYYKSDSITMFEHGDAGDTCDRAISESTENSSCHKKTFVNCEELYDILKILTNLVSLFSVKFIAQVNSSKDFIEILSHEYAEEIQESFLNRQLASYDNKLIVALDDFFDNEYDKFCDDNYIRESLTRIYYEKIEKEKFKQRNAKL